jgi:hypothetical protein
MVVSPQVTDRLLHDSFFVGSASGMATASGAEVRFGAILPATRGQREPDAESRPPGRRSFVVADVD